jgi:hypothetical protein
MNKPLSAAERVRRSRWAGQVETTADRLHQLLLSTPVPMPKEPKINHDLVAGLIELTGYQVDAHPAVDAFNVTFTPSGKNQRDWMQEIAQECRYDRDKSIERYSQMDENGTIPRKRRTMSSHDYAVALWSDGVSKGWLSLADKSLQSKLVADKQSAEEDHNPNKGSKDMDIETSLRSMGKTCFVNYYAAFANPNLSTHDLIETLMDKEGYTETASRTRTSNARRIINSGNAKRALELIVSSGRLPEAIRSQAKKLLSNMG